MSDPEIVAPAVPAEGNVEGLDQDRHANLDAAAPHEAVEAWRTKYLANSVPPDDYLPGGDS